MDEQGRSLEDVCVVIGPHGCQRYGPHTDARGVYYFDLPRNATIEYELRFEMAGYTTVYYRAKPRGPTVFNVVLKQA